MTSMPKTHSAGILTVSDTCAADASQDTCGPRLVTLLQQDLKWRVVVRHIVPDVIGDIQDMIKKWSDEDHLDLIVTSGGTGFAVRDVTPEAVKPLLHKDAPGLVHAMFAKSFTITPFAAMARLVAGVRGSTLIVTVPGSIKGAVENLEAVLKLLPHASDLATDSVNSRAIHAQGTEHISREAGLHQHHHSHQHVSNDPSQSVTRRARESPYPMTSVEDAIRLVLLNTPMPRETTVPIHGSSSYDVTEYHLAEDIFAAEEVPAYRASIVDGYAVVSSDGPGTYLVSAVSHASSGPEQILKAGEIARITTGAPLPSGADAVVMVEDTRLISTTDDGKEERQVAILKTPSIGDNIRAPGSDLKAGTLVMAKHARITPTGGEIGVLASSGRRELKVYRKPVVGVLSTGDELVDPSSTAALLPGQIRDSNRVSLLTTLSAHHYTVIDLGIARDSSESLDSVLRSALSRCDVVITTGGVSMGELDLLKPTIERTLDGTIHFGRVAMKPGKPTTFATVPIENTKDGKSMIFALPGNPASALVTFHLFVLPALRALSGSSTEDLTPRARVVLAHDVVLDSRPEFHRVILSFSQDGRVIASSTGFQRSSRVESLRCQGLLCLPPRSTGLKELKKGEVCDAIIVDRF